MIKDLPNAQTILSELGEDADIWMVANDDEKAVLFVPDRDSAKHVLWMFLKREDCEHFAHILMKLNPHFRETHLVAMKGTVGPALQYAKEAEQQVALITPNKAFEFFTGYEEFLPHYYE